MSFTIDKQADLTRVTMTGAVVDATDLSPMIAGAKGAVIIDLMDLSRMNSVGVREWVRLVHGIPADLDVTLARCPVFFVKQMTMISNFLGKARVVSLRLPYSCVACDEPRDLLVDAAGLPATPPDTTACEACGAKMEWGESDHLYTALLKELGR